MRQVVVLGIAFLAAVTPAAAARRTVIVNATPTDGPAPLRVTFAAAADADWDFGDGTFGAGKTVRHTYAAGKWTARWTSNGESGSVQVVARGVALEGPGHVRYGKRAVFRGTVIPAEGGVAVDLTDGTTTLHTSSGPSGSFAASAKLARGGHWTATANEASAATDVTVVPELRTGLIGSGARGTRFVFAASVRPNDAGSIAVMISRGSTAVVDAVFDNGVRIRLDSGRLTTYTIRARVVPNDGFASVVHVVHAQVVLPQLSFGAHGAAVAQLAGRLRALHYATPLTATFGARMVDAVYAFEKVQGLPRVTRVGAAFWHRLVDPRIPRPRYASPANHLEVDKGHQVLYVVRHGQVALIVPVSTAGLPGRFTPTGRFSIYRKVSGFDPSPLGTLYDPMYFTGGYAIHGNPSVPPYPASHGCVRAPMWVAAYLYETNPYGEIVYVY